MQQKEGTPYLQMSSSTTSTVDLIGNASTHFKKRSV